MVTNKLSLYLAKKSKEKRKQEQVSFLELRKEEKPTIIWAKELIRTCGIPKKSKHQKQ